MLFALLVLFVVVVAAAPALGTRIGRSVLLVAAVPPAVTTVWVAARLGDFVDGTTVTNEVTWVDGLGLELAFRVNALAALLTLLVAGIGVGVFIYAARYFDRSTPDLGPFTANLLGFATAMVGLVWSASVWTLFIFWELTSVTSFLLIGTKQTDPGARRAARRAMLMTVFGGLALLPALVLLVLETGTTRIDELSEAPAGGLATAAAVLVMIAAGTKSAQVPFHSWLPGAMVAPTPVSAYLHSATMVKAGVLLVALMAPALGEDLVFAPLGVTLGLLSMIWGGIGALRHDDMKQALAWGTVSQLGLLVAMFSLNDDKATFAAVGLLAAHAVFKATLFLVVGEIDHRACTRNMSELGGLWRTMPATFVVALVAGLSMAGIPPTLGFSTKEAVVEGSLGLPGATGTVVTAGVLIGSTLTVAYTARLLWGGFGPGPAVTLRPASVLLSTPAAVLSAATFIGYLAMGSVNTWVASAAGTLDTASAGFTLYRWPGLTTALGWSAVVVAAGLVLGWAVVAAQSQAPVRSPAAIGAWIVDQAIDRTVVVSRSLAGVVQHGSLPVYLVTMAGVVVLAGIPFYTDLGSQQYRAWDTPMQGVLAGFVLAGAVVAATLTGRLAAALGLGAVGVAVVGIFVVQGAPDLALTQLLVETIIIVAFVLGLGHLSRKISASRRAWHIGRIAASVGVGAAVALALAAARAARVNDGPGIEMAERAVPDAGGSNVVNVILTDMRALDTLGEVMVLAVVATGVLALLGVRVARRRT